MSDWKSKLPSLGEVMSMTSKLAKGIQTSVREIIGDYKKNHPATDAKQAEEKPAASAEKPAASAEPTANQDDQANDKKE